MPKPESHTTKATHRLIERLEEYGFECEGGPLTNCLDWQELKNLVATIPEHSPNQKEQKGTPREQMGNLPQA